MLVPVRNLGLQRQSEGWAELGLFSLLQPFSTSNELIRHRGTDLFTKTHSDKVMAVKERIVDLDEI